MRSQFKITALAVLLAGTSAWAQKAAVIDMQGAILATKDGQKASAELQAKFGPKEQEINKRGQALVAKQAEFQKTAATLSDAARAGAQRDIEAMQKVLQRDTEDARTDVQAEEGRLLGSIMQRMQSVMQKYAADKQIGVIIDLSSQPNNLLFADKSINITTDIVAAYNAAVAAPMQNPAPATTKPATPPAATPAAAPKAPAAPNKQPGTPGPAKQD